MRQVHMCQHGKIPRHTDKLQKQKGQDEYGLNAPIQTPRNRTKGYSPKQQQLFPGRGVGMGRVTVLFKQTLIFI